MTTSPHDHVLDAFRRRAAAAPDAPLFTFVSDDGRDGPRLSARSLAAASDAVAGFLVRRCDLRRGDRVLLAYTPGLAFVEALVGCLRAGVVAVPVCPPDPRKPEQDMARFAAMAESSGARAILTNGEYARMRALSRVRDVLRRGRAGWPDLPWHTTDGIRPGSHAAPPQVSPSGSDLAVLQYTSGSTSRPRGVMITHENLRHQLAMNASELGTGPDSRAVLWVPHFHDFGLISGILSALFGNGHLYLMSPLSFVRRPAVWLEVMSRVRATHTAAPNFAFDLAVRKTSPEQRRRWDLRSLEVVMSAAEPIRHATVRAFLDAFSASGLRPEAFCPAYGLAEHTVGVSVRGRARLRACRASLERDGLLRAAAEGAGPAEACDLVGCGRPAEGVRVKIVDPASLAPLPEGRVGEIWVDSPSKAAGYFGLPDESREAFQATISTGNDPTGYLRTGDLGAMHGGELFVTGRLKDLIIVRGRNLYPHDIEDSVRGAHPALRPGGVLVFSFDDAARGEERIGVMVELREGPSPAEGRQVAEAVRRAVHEGHGQPVAAVCLVKPGSLPRTTSGKLRRSACRQAFARGEIDASAGTWQIVRFAPPPEPRQDEAPAPAPSQSDELSAMIDELSSLFSRMARARGGRVFHKEATTLRGTLEVLAPPSLPPHRLLSPGRRFPVLVRHANGVTDDDAAPDNRGASVRLLDPERPALAEPLLDLLLTTGPCFLQRSAGDFCRWVKAGAGEREAIARQQPHIADNAWAMFRLPSSYAELHYHSKTARSFVADDGGRFFARFRLVPADGSPDTGFVERTGLLPPERPARARGETRARTFLHDELRARLARGALRYRLELQLRPQGASAREDDEALDCTRTWPEAAFPWVAIAALHLDRIADEAEIEPLSWNPANAPAELSLPPASSPDESASLELVRSQVYARAAEARLAGSKARQKARGGLRVCVVGGGAGGLSAAWELTRQGHQVTVLERGGDVAGKCASITLDGRAFDLGGHVCSDRYVAVRELVEALGVATEPATPTRVYDLERREALPPPDSPELRSCFLRYQALRDASFPAVHSPGLAGLAPSLWQPARSWFAFHDLTPLGEAIAVNFTASGYGFPRGGELSALYLVKAAELAGMLSPPTAQRGERYWTIEGGFGSLWQKVARALPDVRTGVAPVSIRRAGGRVLVRTGEGEETFDALVVATPLAEAGRYLDATDEERALFARVRTLDYVTVAVRARGLPESGFFLVKQHCEGPPRPGHAVAFHHRYPGSDVYLFYAYADEGTTERDIEARLADDIARMGGSLESVHASWRWGYFPHVLPDDIRAGYFERFERLQGQNGTYYVGGLFGFELVEGVVSHALELVRGKLGGGEEPGRGERAPSRAPSRLSGASSEQLVGYLRSLLEESLSLEPGAFDPDEDVARYGLDSIRSMDLLQRIATDTGLSLDPLTLLEHPTARALSALLAERLAGSPDARPRASRAGARAVQGPAGGGQSAWFFRPEPLERPKMRLFCFPHAGGHAARFGSWPRGLPAGVEVCGVQLPGRSPREHEPAIGSFDALLGALEEAIAPLCDVPFAFFGHSAGSLLAFELTRRLRARGKPLPGRLVVSSMEAPEMAAFTLSPWARADLKVALSYRYRPGPPLEAPIALISGDGDLLAPASSFEGWARETSGAFHRVILPGHTRFDIGKAPFLDALSGLLRAIGPAPAGESGAAPLAPADAWVQRPRPLERPALRLFCLYDDNQTLDNLSPLLGALPDGIEVCPVSLPGRDERIDEPRITDFDQLLSALLEALRPHLGAPFALFGHGSGAVLAFELSRRLMGEGGPRPRLLIASSNACPSYYASTLVPSLAAEYTLSASWHYRAEPPLPLPITVLGGEDDAICAPPVLDAWREHTTEGFSLVMLPGGHFHLQTGERRFLEELSRALLSPGPEKEAPLALGQGGRLASLVARLRETPHASTGPFDAYERCWAARVTRPGSRGAPMFPELLAGLSALAGDDAFFARCHPHAALVVSLSLANTLAQHDERAEGRYEPMIRRAVGRAIEAIARARKPLFSGAGSPYGRHHVFSIVWGRWLLPAHEAERLLEGAGRYLSGEEARALASLVGPAQKRFGPGEEQGFDPFFERDSLVLHFAEHFPDRALETEAAAAHAARAEPLPGFTVAFASRYYEKTRDQRTLARLSSALSSGGLWVGGDRMELIFGLRFLLEGGVDVALALPEEVRRLAAMMTPRGVTVEAHGPVFDCDLTAMTQALLHRLGLPSPMVTEALDRWWSDERQSYESFDGNHIYIVSAALHVLEAFLVAPDITHEQARSVWRRTLRLLDERPWVELYHMSPYYPWEHIVSTLAEHAARFPEEPTTAHHRALGLILEGQDACGGFSSPYTQSPNREETALALLAIKAALRAGMSPPGGQLERAAHRAQAFLAAQGPAWEGDLPALWTAKVPIAPTNIIEAAIVGSLHAPTCNRRDHDDGGAQPA